jgi:hypothetical protein
MSYIQDITINISIASLGLQGRSFDPLIIATGATPIALQTFTNPTTLLADMVTGGYQITDAEYLMASSLISQDVQPSKVKVIRASGTYANALTSLRATDDEWYGILIASRAKADLNAVGTWANSNDKFFLGCSSDLTAYAGRSLDHEAYFMHDAPTDYPDAALMGKCLPKTPGSVSWKWKVLSGQTKCAFTSTQLELIRTANCMAYTYQSGQSFTNNGAMTSGVPIDTIIFKDWLQNDMIIGLLGLMINNDKIPEDDTGIAQIENVLRGSLKRGAQNGGIAAAVSDDDLKYSDDKKYMYQVFVPKRADISANDRAEGLVPGITFRYYQGRGVDQIEVNGYILA